MYYVLDDKGNKIEAYSKEEIMAVLQQAIADGSLSGVDAQSAFVSKLKCCVDGGTFKQAFITEAKYNELKENKQLEANTIYNILDDNTLEVITTNIEGLWEAIDAIGGDNGVIDKIVSISEYFVDDDQKIQVSKQGKIVVLNMCGTPVAKTTIDGKLFILKDGYRPKYMQRITCYLTNDYFQEVGLAHIYIYEDGTFYIYCDEEDQGLSSSRYLNCNITFITN